MSISVIHESMMGSGMYDGAGLTWPTDISRMPDELYPIPPL